MASHIAEESRSQRQMLRSRIFIFDAMLEIFKLSYLMSKITRLSSDEREKLADQAKEKRMEVHNAVHVEIELHLKAGVFGLPRDELTELFENPANMIIGEWQKLEAALRSGVFYSPVSYAERKRIINFQLSKNLLLI